MPHHLGDPLARADRTAFVKDGFNFWAFVFGPLFLLVVLYARGGINGLLGGRRD